MARPRDGINWNSSNPSRERGSRFCSEHGLSDILPDTSWYLENTRYSGCTGAKSPCPEGMGIRGFLFRHDRRDLFACRIRTSGNRFITASALAGAHVCVMVHQTSRKKTFFYTLTLTRHRFFGYSLLINTT